MTWQDEAHYQRATPYFRTLTVRDALKMRQSNAEHPNLRQKQANSCPLIKQFPWHGDCSGYVKAIVLCRLWDPMADSMGNDVLYTEVAANNCNFGERK